MICLPGIFMRLLFGIALTLLVTFFSLAAVPPAYAVNIDKSEDYSHLQQIEQGPLLEQTPGENCFSTEGLEGLKTCKNLLVQDQNNPEAWNRLGRIFYDLERYNEAYLSFQYATYLQADYALAWANTCAVLSQLQSYEEALDACDKSLSFNLSSQGAVDKTVLALNNKAVALYFLGRYRESLKVSDQALVLKPDDSQAQINRAVTLHALAHTTTPKHEGLT